MAATGGVLRTLGVYVKALALNAAIVTGLYIAGLAVAGVPWWFLTGILCGVANLVPHLGPLLALGVALLAKMLIANDWISLAYVAGIWLVIQLVDGFFLSPRAAGLAGVNPLISIVVTLAAGLMLGPVGMVLAVPVLIVAGILMRNRRQRRNAAPGPV